MTDCFSDVPGLAIGHAHDPHINTGVTLIVPDLPMVMAVDVRGGGPGTRETDALNPSTLVERVHGLALAGGSVYGLAAADELVLALAAAGHGLDIGPGLPRVPVVPAAILFDLANGGDKKWGTEPPYRRLTRAAFDSLGKGDDSGRSGAGYGDRSGRSGAGYGDRSGRSGAGYGDRSGRSGAGYGARAGSRPGGIGSVSATLSTGHRIGALIAVNSFGEVYAGAPPEGPVAMPKRRGLDPLADSAGSRNTSIGAIATNAPLTRAQAQRVAMMAHDGLARCIRPIHCPFDGDSLFVISTAADTSVGSDATAITEIGTIAADLVARAVRRAVFGGHDGAA
jgi:L-aminopeptidase/D-esterase-like protein